MIIGFSSWIIAEITIEAIPPILIGLAFSLLAQLIVDSLASLNLER
jgi:hypothetical protein